MDQAATQYEIDIMINDMVSNHMDECIQRYEEAKKRSPRVFFNFNYFLKPLPMHTFPKLPTTNFGITRDVLSREERKKGNKARFSELYLDDIPLGYIGGETYLVSLPPITLGI